MPVHTTETLVIVFCGEHKSGRRLFDGLLEANSTSFWNKPFMDAIASLRYTGFVRPSTLFVAAPSHHLECIRAAYAKRMLKSLPRVSIASLGEMGSIRPVQQLPFVPLADAFLDGVAALHNIGRAATLSSVLHQIVNRCPQMDAPNRKMLSATMEGLLEEGLIYTVGNHLFVTPVAAKTTVECQTGDSMMVVPTKKEGLFARLFSRKVASPCKGVEKKKERSPLAPTSLPQPSSYLPDWECKGGIREERTREFRPSVYSTRPRTSRHQKRREDRHHQRTQQYRTSSDEDNHYPIYPTTNYGPIDPPESIERFHREKKNQMTRPSAPMPSSVPIPSRARASTPTSSDSAYSRSVSEQSDNDDHTYVNLRNGSEMEETQFEECTMWNGPSTPIVTVM